MYLCIRTVYLYICISVYLHVLSGIVVFFFLGLAREKRIKLVAENEEQK